MDPFIRHNYYCHFVPHFRSNAWLLNWLTKICTINRVVCGEGKNGSHTHTHPRPKTQPTNVFHLTLIMEWKNEYMNWTHWRQRKVETEQEWRREKERERDRAREQLIQLKVVWLRLLCYARSSLFCVEKRNRFSSTNAWARTLTNVKCVHSRYIFTWNA